MAGMLGSLLGAFGQGKREKKNLEGYLGGIGGEAASVMGEGAESVEEANANLEDQFGMANKLNQQAAGGYQGPGMVASQSGMATPYAQDDGVAKDSTDMLPADEFNIKPMAEDTSKMALPGLKQNSVGILYKDTTGQKFDRESQQPVNLGDTIASPDYDFMYEGRRNVKWGADSTARKRVDYYKNNNSPGSYPEGFNADTISKFFKPTTQSSIGTRKRRASTPITF